VLSDAVIGEKTRIVEIASPSAMQIPSHNLKPGHEWVLAAFLITGAILLGNVVHWIAFTIIRYRRKEVSAKAIRVPLNISEHLNHPARWVFLTICVLSTFPWLPIPSGVAIPLREGLRILLVILIGWFAIGCVYVLQDALMRRFDLKAENNVRARRIHTQTHFLRRILIGFIIVVDFGCVLWTFPDPQLWHYGSGLIASAGVATLVLATAAKSTVANLLAGLQVAFSEPIRIDDVVVVEGEWGRIEEITTSYVVIRIWDLRRLIVPLSYFIEHPFQNWTREHSDLLGTAFLYTDYTVSVASIRDHLARVLDGSPLWDRKVCSTQVTNLSERTMEIRCLLSARNSSDLFDLRCIIREEMVKFIQQNYPDAFPLTRFSSLPDSRELISAAEPASLRQ
jgi:small-conductance mechanosensitive channel